MQLMATTVSPAGEVATQTVVDDVVCECCPTALAVSSSGPVIAYRDKRTPPTVPVDSHDFHMEVVRDIALARLVDGGDLTRWSSGTPVHEDGWVFNGCPNNGPSIAASDDRLVVAWWTGEGERPRVQARVSGDGGRTFGALHDVSGEGRPTGHVSAMTMANGALVLWLQDNEVKARHVGDEESSSIASLGAAANGYRLPSMVPLPDGSLLGGWVDADRRLQLRRIRVQ
jgi:hypothetical protein